MQSRRRFLKHGLGAIAIGAYGRNALGAALRPGGLRTPPTGPATLVDPADPLGLVPLTPNPVIVDGVPYRPGWYGGDAFPDDEIPFHSDERGFVDGRPPQPTESVKLVVVGGGISGLSTAFMLREFNPVVFELQRQFGGTSRGGTWQDTSYSQGGAYIITPDEGSSLESLYTELGLDQVVRVDADDPPIEVDGEILDSFWEGIGVPPEDVPAFQAYAAVVQFMAEEAYPEIPVPAGPDGDWIRALDEISFKDDVEQRMGMPAPQSLADAIQAYFYSSFNAGWEEISAASGWNFVAAEEFGRWVFPGGNAYIVDRLWRRLKEQEAASAHAMLRPDCRVVDVRVGADRRAQVTYRDDRGKLASMLADRVVMACSKHICKYILHDLERHDQQRTHDMHAVETRAYVVATVLLDHAIERDFYDIFLTGQPGQFPTSEGEATTYWRLTDVLSGHYARPGPSPRSVLTLYWPLPFASGRFTLMLNEPWQAYAESLAEQLPGILGLLETPVNAIREVRLTRWGHAMPVARTGFIAQGRPERLIAPFRGAVYFVNQDNWALPAVENCLLDAANIAPEIAAALA